MESWRKAVALGIALGLCGCDVALLRGLTPEEARAVSAVLDQHGLVARVVPDGNARVRLELNESAVADAVATLARTGAATRSTPDAAASNGQAWLETAAEARARTEQRLEAALAASLARLPAVVEARVHLSLPTGMRALPEARTPPAASVLLVRSGDAAPSPVVAAARELVAGAVPELTPAAVRVVETRQRAEVPVRFARVGPIVVTKQSEGFLKAAIATALLLQLLLAAAVLRPILRRRRRDEA